MVVCEILRRPRAGVVGKSSEESGQAGSTLFAWRILNLDFYLPFLAERYTGEEMSLSVAAESRTAATSQHLINFEKKATSLSQECLFTETWHSVNEDYVLSLAILTVANSINVGPRVCSLSSISGPVHTNPRQPSEFQVTISLNCIWKQFRTTFLLLESWRLCS
jgi:hypothetical protein